MKKCLSWVLILVMILSCTLYFTSCTEPAVEDDLSDKVREKVTAYLADLDDVAETLSTKEAIRDYLCSWAKARDIAYTVDSYDNIILQIKSSKAYAEADPVVILCPYDERRFADNTEPVAMALYLAKNNEETGRLTIIFTAESDHDFGGIQNLSTQYIPKNAKIFCVNHGERNSWAFQTGARSSYQFTREARYTKPNGNKAYRVKISGLPGGVPDVRVGAYPNPIKEIGDLLAYFKTNAMIFELAKVTGGSTGDLYPKSASVTLVINEDDTEKFEARMETAIENFFNRHSNFLDDYPDVTYTYEEVKMPKRVLTQSRLNNFISVLYTLLNGVYYTDEEENLISITNIGAVRCGDEEITISAVANSLSPSNLEEIDTTYETICGLSNFDYKLTGSQDLYAGDPESDLTIAVAQAFNDYCGKNIEWKGYVPATNASYIHQMRPDADIVNVAVNWDRLERYTGTILTFLINQKPDQEEE